MPSSARVLKTPFLSAWKETGFSIPKESRQGKAPLHPSGTGGGKSLRSIVALCLKLLAPRFGCCYVLRGTPHAVTLARRCKAVALLGTNPKFCCVGAEEVNCRLRQEKLAWAMPSSARFLNLREC